MSAEGQLRVDDVFEPVGPCYLCGRPCRRVSTSGMPSVCDGCGREELGTVAPAPTASQEERTTVPQEAPPAPWPMPAVGPRPPLDPAEELWLLELWSREEGPSPQAPRDP